MAEFEGLKFNAVLIENITVTGKAIAKALKDFGGGVDLRWLQKELDQLHRATIPLQGDFAAVGSALNKFSTPVGIAIGVLGASGTAIYLTAQKLKQFAQDIVALDALRAQTGLTFGQLEAWQTASAKWLVSVEQAGTAVQTFSNVAAQMLMQSRGGYGSDLAEALKSPQFSMYQSRMPFLDKFKALMSQDVPQTYEALQLTIDEMNKLYDEVLEAYGGREIPTAVVAAQKAKEEFARLFFGDERYAMAVGRLPIITPEDEARATRKVEEAKQYLAQWLRAERAVDRILVVLKNEAMEPFRKLTEKTAKFADEMIRGEGAGGQFADALGDAVTIAKTIYETWVSLEEKLKFADTMGKVVTGARGESPEQQEMKRRLREQLEKRSDIGGSEASENLVGGADEDVIPVSAAYTSGVMDAMRAFDVWRQGGVMAVGERYYGTQWPAWMQSIANVARSPLMGYAGYATPGMLTPGVPPHKGAETVFEGLGGAFVWGGRFYDQWRRSTATGWRGGGGTGEWGERSPEQERHTQQMIDLTRAVNKLDQTMSPLTAALTTGVTPAGVGGGVYGMGGGRSLGSFGRGGGGVGGRTGPAWYGGGAGRSGGGGGATDEEAVQPGGPEPYEGYNSDLAYLRSRGGHDAGFGKGGEGPHSPELVSRAAAAGRAYEAENPGKQARFGEMSRSNALQAQYYRNYRAGGGKAAPPGASQHNPSRGGRAIDLPDSDFRRWMYRGGGRRFGTHFPVSNDAPHMQADPSYKGPSFAGRRSTRAPSTNVEDRRAEPPSGRPTASGADFIQEFRTQDLPTSENIFDKRDDLSTRYEQIAGAIFVDWLERNPNTSIEEKMEKRRQLLEQFGIKERDNSEREAEDKLNSDLYNLRIDIAKPQPSFGVDWNAEIEALQKRQRARYNASVRETERAMAPYQAPWLRELTEDEMQRDPVGAINLKLARRSMDQTLSDEISPEATGNLRVDVNAPAGVQVRASGEGMFEGNVEMSRSMPMDRYEPAAAMEE